MGAYLAPALRFDGRQIGAAYGAFAIGSMISPFFVGLVADRYFASVTLLGALGLLGGAVICLVPRAEAFGEFYPLLILYCATFAPILWGVGAFAGTLLAGMVLAAHELPVKSGTIAHDWAGIWMPPAVGAVAVLAAFLLFFRDPDRATTDPARDPPPGEGTP